MKIVFIGSVVFSERILQKLISLNTDLIGVCTIKHSSFNSDHVDLSSLSRENNIPVLYTPELSSKKSIDWISSLNPEIIFCFGWSGLLKKELLQIPPMGVIGYHPTALPKNRGRHPITWALNLGLKETASTFFFMDDGIDSGDILSQKKVLITKNDDANSLYEKLIVVAENQIEKLIPKLELGKYKRIKQNYSQANYWRKRNVDDGKIDWRMTAQSIHNLVRGLAKPYEGAHFNFSGKKIKVWKVEIVNNYKPNIEPGKVLENRMNTIIVKTGRHSVKFKLTDPEITIKPGTHL